MDRHGRVVLCLSFCGIATAVHEEDMILWPVLLGTVQSRPGGGGVDHAHATDDDLHARRRMQSLLTPPACQRPGPISGTPSLFHHPFHALTLPLGTAARVSVISKHLHP